jgi:Tol biopolymer transport system component
MATALLLLMIGISLLAGANAYAEPILSPDSTKVAEVRGETLYVETAGEEPRTELFHQEEGTGNSWVTSIWGNTSRFWHLSPPVWSPDSKRLAYTTKVDGVSWFSLWVVDFSGSAPKSTEFIYKECYFGTHAPVFEPSWSPDGKKLTYRMNAEPSSRISALGGVVMARENPGRLFRLCLAEFNDSGESPRLSRLAAVGQIEGPVWSSGGERFEIKTRLNQHDRECISVVDFSNPGKPLERSDASDCVVSLDS